MTRKLLLVAALSLPAFGQNLPTIAPVPRDPLELVTGPVQTVNTPAARMAVTQLLARARRNYALTNSTQGYQLKVTFNVTSGGQTDYDGAWQMEDTFDPQQGLHWTANASAGYTATRISSKTMSAGTGTATILPLRLHEARAALFDPIPSAASVAHDTLRTSSATFNGVQLTCVLISNLATAATESAGRHWEETEECIDPQSGLLQVHSQVPGRYYQYSYANAVRLGSYVLPDKVTVTEAGQTVSEIHVDSLTAMAAPDPNLFVASEAMKSAGPVIAMAGSQKVSVFSELGPYKEGATAQPVCVFGVVTPEGQLVEAHSLQPSDPNSQAAVEAAKKMKFATGELADGRPQQHFVFVIEKFVTEK
jgi:hypothetical protein